MKEHEEMKMAFNVNFNSLSYNANECSLKHDDHRHSFIQVAVSFVESVSLIFVSIKTAIGC